MKPLIPSQELALKKLLLALRTNHPNAPAIAIAPHSAYDNDEGKQVHYVELKLPGTDFFCRIFEDGVRSYPGGAQGLTEASVDVLSWQARLNLVGEWADKAILEREAVIELREIDKEFGDEGVSTYAEAPDDEMFNDSERAQLDVDLMAFANQVGIRFDALKSQVGGVDGKLQQLQQQQEQILAAIERLRISSEKMGKKDWSNLAMGTALSVVASAVVPAEVAQQIVQDFFAQLSHVRLLTGG